MSWLSVQDSQTLLRLHIQPGARESAIVGLHGDRLKIKIKAPPVDGEANEELCRFLASLLGVSKSSVEIVRGQTSRQKDLLIKKSPAEARDLLETFI